MMCKYVVWSAGNPRIMEGCGTLCCGNDGQINYSFSHVGLTPE